MSTTGDSYSTDYLRNKDLFFIVDERSDKLDLVLPEGLYLSLSYRGELLQTKQYVLQMLDYARQQNYRIMSDPIEMCLIDTFETEQYDEYVTELQIAVAENVTQ